MGEKPPPRLNHILAPVGGKSYLLMGQVDPFEVEAEREKVAATMWVFDHAAEEWEERMINKEEKPPGMRTGGFIAHDKYIYAFGGREDAGNGRYNKLHKFDTEQLRWIALPPNANPAVDVPMPKAGCEPVVIDGKFCLFGGYGTPADPYRESENFVLDGDYNDRGHTNEFHLYNLNTAAVHEWIPGRVRGDRPLPCSYYTLTLVDSRRAVLFGGNTITGRINDVYIMTLDGVEVIFQKVKKYGPWPKKRSSHTACVLNYNQEFPQLLVVGGLDENTQPLGDMWLFSVDHGMWTKVLDHKECLQRWRPIMSCVSLEEGKVSILFFGGVDKDGYKVSKTTLLNFQCIMNCGAAPEWRMEQVLEKDSMRGPSVPVQATEN